MLEFLGTYEEQAVGLKIKAFEAAEKKTELETKLQEVGHCGTSGDATMGGMGCHYGWYGCHYGWYGCHYGWYGVPLWVVWGATVLLPWCGMGGTPQGATVLNCVCCTGKEQFGSPEA